MVEDAGPAAGGFAMGAQPRSDCETATRLSSSKSSGEAGVIGIDCIEWHNPSVILRANDLAVGWYES
jgi:hypothetical protein